MIWSEKRSRSFSKIWSDLGNDLDHSDDHDIWSRSFYEIWSDLENDLDHIKSDLAWG